MAAVVMAVAIENATTYWASDMLRTQTSMGAGLASAAVTALVAGMSVARFTLGPLSLRVSPESLLIGSFALAGVGWLIFWLSSAPALAMLGLVVAGLGYGAQYPIGVVLVLRASEGRPDAAQARSSFASGGALAVAPFLLGAVADALGTHTAFLLIPVLLVLGGLAVAAGRGALLRAGTAVTA
ncbi:major facilitator superfamily protein [mine drainage metagenome]|uniref:Major facilitator superfamily protein n=1 Tax=mine drainage metagenome TaxID=410659 RepID=A0A1J5QHB3_9ZZZZ